MHFVESTWLSVEFWQSEVTLLENIFLVKLWDTLAISLIPSIEHDLGEIRSVFFDSVGRAAVSGTGISHSADAVRRSEFGTDRGLIRRLVATFALIQLSSSTAVFHLLINILFLIIRNDIVRMDDRVDIVAWHAVNFELIIQLD